MHSNILMHDVETLKSFNAQLAVDYPAYSMVICQVKDKVTLVMLILYRMGENDSYFCQL